MRLLVGNDNEAIVGFATTSPAAPSMVPRCGWLPWMASRNANPRPAAMRTDDPKKL